MKNWMLLRALKGRGVTTQSLAEGIGSCRTHVSQVLNNVPGRGGQTRRKLAPLLTDEELDLAGWDGAGNVLRGTLSQGAGWNAETQRRRDAEGTNLTPGRTAGVGEAARVVAPGSEAGWESASGKISPSAVLCVPSGGAGASGELAAVQGACLPSLPHNTHGPLALLNSD